MNLDTFVARHIQTSFYQLRMGECEGEFIGEFVIDPPYDENYEEAAVFCSVCGEPIFNGWIFEGCFICDEHVICEDGNDEEDIEDDEK